MNIFFWVLQVLVSLHTLAGAVWKFSNSAEQTMPSFKAIPNGLWTAMGGLEIFLSLCLLVPFVYNSAAFLVPAAAVCIVFEMLAFTCLHLYSGDLSRGPIIYWLAVAALCGFLAYGRLVLLPIH